MTIFDPHIHLWNPRTTPREATPLVKLLSWSPWLLDKATRALMPKPIVDFVGKPDYVLSNHLPDIFHRDTGKYEVEGYVHIQAGWQGKKPIDYANETRWLEGLKPAPAAIVGHASLNDLIHLDKVLDAHFAASKRFKGVRDMVACHPSKGVHDWHQNPKLMLEEDFQKGYARLGERGLTYDCFLYSNQLLDFVTLAKAVPSTKVVLDHVGAPVALMNAHGGAGLNAKERAQIKAAWYEGLEAVAAISQVHLKLSGLFMPIVGFDFHLRETPPSHQEVVDSIAPHIEFALKTFGVERCMFASNFPMDKVSLSYEMLYDAYFKIVENYSTADKEQLFRSNAKAFYGV